MSEQYRGRPLIDPDSPAAWRDWLVENHRAVDGAWLARWTKASGHPSIPYESIVEEALCFGWIDGLVNSLPGGRQVHLMTPRRRGSGWSRSNKERVERLIAAGRMTDAGLAVIEAARADGSWAMLDEVESLTEPPDLSAALDARPEARLNWDRFTPSSRRTLLWWVISAKRSETRARRVATIVEEAMKGRPAGF